MDPAPPPHPVPPARLRVDGVTVAFGATEALRSVTLEVPPGRVVGVIGPNGAGKTTLLNVVCGDTEPSAGTIQMDGAPLEPTPFTLGELGIARTLQNHELPPGKEVLDHVLAGALPPPRNWLRGWLRERRPAAGRDHDPEFKQHAAQLLRELGLAHAVDTELQALSPADRARAEIARATIVFPRLLLLDEPAAGLGPQERAGLAKVIRGLATRPGRDCSVVLVDHHFDLISQACDTVVVLEEGRVLATGTPDEIARRPEVVTAYLSED